MPGESSEPFDFIERGRAAQQAMNDLGVGTVDPYEGHVVVFDGDLQWSIEHSQACRDHPTRPMSSCPASQVMRAMTEPPISDPGRYYMRRDRGAVLFDKDDNARSQGWIELLEEALTKFGGGQLVITSPEAASESRLLRNEWSVALVMGREAEDSDMAGGAAYGIALDLREALRSALDQAGVR